MAEGNSMSKEVKTEDEEVHLGEDKREPMFCSPIKGDTG